MKRISLLVILFSFYLCSLALAQVQLGTTAELIEAFEVGGDYVLAAGEYNIPETVRISGDFSLTGAGMNESTLFLHGSLAALQAKGSINLNLTDLSLEYAGKKFADVLVIEDANFTLERIRLVGGVFGENQAGVSHGVGLVLLGEASGQLLYSELIVNDYQAYFASESSELEMWACYFQNNRDGLVTKPKLYGLYFVQQAEQIFITG